LSVRLDDSGRVVDLRQDEALVHDILGGDTGAFTSLMEKYKPLVIHVVYRMIRTDADREDLLQDVFLKVYQNLGGFGFRSKLSTWIARIAYNTCVNFMEKRREVLVDDEFPERGGFDAMPGRGPLPDTAAVRKDLSERLEAEIARLPAKYRTILTLYHLDWMTYQEIGEVLGLPDGTVKSYLFRAREHLREVLSAKYRREDL
jgi:RNA polymerase sigma factor (sigma-70 family)